MGEAVSLYLWERPDEVNFSVDMLRNVPRCQNGTDVIVTIPKQKPAATASCGHVSMLGTKPDIELGPLLHDHCRLQHATREGHIDAVKAILQKGFDADVRSSSGFTPLSMARFKDRRLMVGVLLDTHVVDFIVQDKIGRTPLMLPIAGAFKYVVWSLLHAAGDYGHDAYCCLWSSKQKG